MESMFCNNTQFYDGFEGEEAVVFLSPNRNTMDHSVSPDNEMLMSHFVLFRNAFWIKFTSYSKGPAPSDAGLILFIIDSTGNQILSHLFLNKQVNLTTEYKLHKRALQTKFVQFMA